MAENQSISELQRAAYESQILGAAQTSELVGASATAAAGAANAQTLPAVAGKTNFLMGFVITTGQPAAVVNGVVTVTGLKIGTMSFQIVQSVNNGGSLDIHFPQPLPASAVNTAITVTLPAIVGGAVSAVAVYGFVR